MNIKCWSPNYETEDDARDYDDAESIRSAVEAFAKWSHGEEPFDEIEVRARNLENGELYSFQVDAEMVLEISVGLGEKIDESAEHAEDSDPETTDAA